MNVVIFGCGRTGASLALRLAKEHKVTVIEQNAEALKRLGHRNLCKTIIGSGLEEDILEKAGLSHADAFFAMTRGDNSNIMAAQIVRMKYKTPKICIRIADPYRALTYSQLGYFCINACTLISGIMQDWFLEKPYQPIDIYNKLPKEMEIL